MAVAASQIVVMEEARDGDRAQLYGAGLALTLSRTLVLAGIFLFRRGLKGTAADGAAIYPFAVPPVWLSAWVGALRCDRDDHRLLCRCVVAGCRALWRAAPDVDGLLAGYRIGGGGPSVTVAGVVQCIVGTCLLELLGAALLVTATEAWRLFVPEATKLAIAIPIGISVPLSRR